MLTLNQKGIMNPLAIPLILAVLAVLTTGGFAIYSYMNFIDQRDNNQPKIEAAVRQATETQAKELEAEFKEREKEPNKTYTAPSEFGSVKLTYPKTWSAYVDQSGSNEIEFFAHPGVVPVSDVNLALKMSVTSRDFANEVKQYDAEVEKGELRAGAVEVSGVKGVRLEGFIEKDQEGIMVMFPLRDKTLRIWTESKEFSGDFNNIVIKKLSFSP